MSIKLMTRVFEDVHDLQPAHKLVLLKLCDNANDESMAWPSIATIARTCDVSERSAKRYTKALQDKGYIKVVSRGGGGKEGARNKSNVYKITLGANLASSPNSLGTTGVELGDSGGNSLGTELCPPNHQLNHQLNHHTESPIIPQASQDGHSQARHIDSQGKESSFNSQTANEESAQSPQPPFAAAPPSPRLSVPLPAAEHFKCLQCGNRAPMTAPHGSGKWERGLAGELFCQPKCLAAYNIAGITIDPPIADSQQDLFGDTMTAKGPENGQEGAPASNAGTDMASAFDAARKTFPGRKRGLGTELANFKKKNAKNWKQIVPLLLPAIEREEAFLSASKAAGKFCPEWKNFGTWINQRCWEEEFPEIKTGQATITGPDLAGYGGW